MDPSSQTALAVPVSLQSTHFIIAAWLSGTLTGLLALVAPSVLNGLVAAALIGPLLIVAPASAAALLLEGLTVTVFFTVLGLLPFAPQSAEVALRLRFIGLVLLAFAVHGLMQGWVFPQIPYLTAEEAQVSGLLGILLSVLLAHQWHENGLFPGVAQLAAVAGGVAALLWVVIAQGGGPSPDVLRYATDAASRVTLDDPLALGVLAAGLLAGAIFMARDGSAGQQFALAGLVALLAVTPALIGLAVLDGLLLTATLALLLQVPVLAALRQHPGWVVVLGFAVSALYVGLWSWLVPEPPPGDGLSVGLRYLAANLLALLLLARGQVVWRSPWPALIMLCLTGGLWVFAALAGWGAAATATGQQAAAATPAADAPGAGRSDAAERAQRAEAAKALRSFGQRPASAGRDAAGGGERQPGQPGQPGQMGQMGQMGQPGQMGQMGQMGQGAALPAQGTPVGDHYRLMPGDPQDAGAGSSASVLKNEAANSPLTLQTSPEASPELLESSVALMDQLGAGALALGDDPPAAPRPGTPPADSSPADVPVRIHAAPAAQLGNSLWVRGRAPAGLSIPALAERVGGLSLHWARAPAVPSGGAAADGLAELFLTAAAQRRLREGGSSAAGTPLADALSPPPGAPKPVALGSGQLRYVQREILPGLLQLVRDYAQRGGADAEWRRQLDLLSLSAEPLGYQLTTRQHAGRAYLLLRPAATGELVGGARVVFRLGDAAPLALQVPVPAQAAAMQFAWAQFEILQGELLVLGGDRNDTPGGLLGAVLEGMDAARTLGPRLLLRVRHPQVAEMNAASTLEAAPLALQLQPGASMGAAQAGMLDRVMRQLETQGWQVAPWQVRQAPAVGALAVATLQVPQGQALPPTSLLSRPAAWVMLQVPQFEIALERQLPSLPRRRDGLAAAQLAALARFVTGGDPADLTAAGVYLETVMDRTAARAFWLASDRQGRLLGVIDPTATGWRGERVRGTQALDAQRLVAWRERGLAYLTWGP